MYLLRYLIYDARYIYSSITMYVLLLLERGIYAMHMLSIITACANHEKHRYVLCTFITVEF